MYSIGYQGISAEKLEEILTEKKVTHLVDVRSKPYSRWKKEFNKPVLDDEPARCGLKEHGGIPGGTHVEEHIAQIEAVRGIGSYHVYHHDLFQRPRDNPATPPSGIPDPDYSPYHRQVFDYLKEHTTW